MGALEAPNFGLPPSIRPETINGLPFWSNTRGDGGNPTLIAAQLLAERGHAITITEEAYAWGDIRLEGDVAIYASEDAKSAIIQATDLPEFQSVRKAREGLLIGVRGGEEIRNGLGLDETDFDEITKRRVEALYHKKHGDIIQYSLREDGKKLRQAPFHVRTPLHLIMLMMMYGEYKEDKKRLANERARERALIGNQGHLSPSEIQSLLAEALNRRMPLPSVN